MKKTIIIISLIMTFSVSNAQDKFEFRENSGLTDFVVIELPNQSKSEIYDELILWVKRSYINSDEVIQTTIENEMIRFKGNYSDIIPFGRSVYSNGADYVVQIDIKDGKIKLDPLSFVISVAGRSADYLLTNQSTGKMFKKGKIKPMFKDVVAVETAVFNNMINTIKNPSKSDKDGW